MNSFYESFKRRSRYAETNLVKIFPVTYRRRRSKNQIGSNMEEVMRLANTILTVTFVLSLPGAVGAATLNVPDDYSTIQAGINAVSRGGGIYTWAGASPVIDCNTFSDNSADYGGAIYCGVDCAVTVKNTILWDDYADHGQETYVYEGASAALTYSDVDGGWTGTGNINSDPEFLLPSKNDYRLLQESPCIDAAQPGYYDPDSTRMDMGAHCFDQDDHITLYITPDATEVAQGGNLGVTYTFINTNGQSEQYILLTQVVLPNNSTLNVIGPQQKTTAAGTTSQVYETHYIPPSAPTNTYEYWSRIGVAPSTLYDEDSFMFRIVAP